MDIPSIDIHPFGVYKIPFPCENTTHCHHIELSFYRGTYLVELWGAGSSSGGGYVSGEIHFYSEQTLYCFIGGSAPQTSDFRGVGGFNGGGTSTKIGNYRQIGGDGSTDLRIEVDNISSRIIVSGGAGGGVASYPGGYGGGLIGGNGTTSDPDSGIIGEGGTQTEGGLGQFQGEFGIGAKSNPGGSTDLAGCGGGGWYGGGSGYHYDYYASGGGGSSYISGYHGCLHHPSGMQFFHPTMISGNLEMPSPSGEHSIGHFGNGYIKITSLDPQSTCNHPIYNNFLHFIIPFVTLSIFYIHSPP